MTNLSLSDYGNKYIITHSHVLDSFYKALSHSAFVSHLLYQCYKRVEDKMTARLCTTQFLNFYIDGLNKIRKG